VVKKFLSSRKFLPAGEISIFILGLLVLAGAIGVLSVQERQIIQEKAAGRCTNPDGNEGTRICTTDRNFATCGCAPAGSSNCFWLPGVCDSGDLLYCSNGQCVNSLPTNTPRPTTPPACTVGACCGCHLKYSSGCSCDIYSPNACGNLCPTSPPGATNTPAPQSCACGHQCTPGQGGCWWGAGLNYCNSLCCSLGACPTLRPTAPPGATNTPRPTSPPNQPTTPPGQPTSPPGQPTTPPGQATNTPAPISWLPAPECRRSNGGLCSNRGVKTYANYTDARWCDCCLQCAPLPTFGLSRDWCYGPTPKAVGYGCITSTVPTLTPTPGSTTGGWCREKTWAWNGTSEKLAGVCCSYDGMATACEGIRYMKSKTQENQLASSPSDYDKVGEGCQNPNQPQNDFWCCKACAGGGGGGGGGGEVACLMPTTRPKPTVSLTPTPSGPTSTPSVSPTPTPNVPYLFIRLRFKGFPTVNPPKMEATLVAKGTGFIQTVIISEEGESGPIFLEDLDPGQTYDFLVSSWGFLVAKQTLKITTGRNPAYGLLDFGLLKPGDLNSDNQINGIDWSLMKINYAVSGD